jgi:general secretion pathway protein D
VRDAQTIVISGLIQDNSTATDQGVPLLRSIPLIGRLFSYTSRTSNKINLLVFLTPKIIYDAETLQKISYDMRNQQQQLLAPTERNP